MTPEQLDEIETYEPRYEPTTGRVRMRRFLDGVWVHISRLRSAERERDEARAEVERLRAIVEVNDQRLADCWDQGKAEAKRAFTDGARAMKVEMLQAALRLTYDGELWPELILRLRDASVEKKGEE